MMPDDLAKKKQSSRFELYGGGCFFLFLMPVLIFALNFGLIGLLAALSSLVSNGLNDFGLFLTFFFLVFGGTLSLLIWRRIKRLNFVRRRIRGLRQELQRTSNLIERDTSRLEMPESEIDTVTLPDAELRRTQQG